MPRNVRDSDEETEPKSGRRMRAALNSSVLDSPLRRSSRIKQPSAQEGSSPESVSDVSSVGTTRSTRRRNATGDTAEPPKSLRTRRNSVASDISELTETESLPDGPAKRITRRSIASVPATETPPNVNGRSRRTTRAGSEAKSTSPRGRTTRKTRASSLEPEGIDDQKIREVGTPVKSRRRASVMPSEPAVAEESEDSGRTGRRTVEKTVYEIDEDESVFVDSTAHNTSKSSRRKSKTDANESVEQMEVDESPVRGSEGNTIEKSAEKNAEAGTDISHMPKKPEESIEVTDSSEAKKIDEEAPQTISSPSKSSSYTMDSLVLSPAKEKQEKSPGNKENEILNESAAALLERTVKSSNIDVRLLSRKSLNSAYVKPQEKRHNISVDDGLLANYCGTPIKTQEAENSELAKNSTETLKRKERYSVDDCVVIIEPMEIDHVDKIVAAKVSNTPETRKVPKSSEVAASKSEATEEEDANCKLSGKDVENIENVVNEDIQAWENHLKISNVVSIATDEEKETTKKKQEEIKDSEPSEASNHKSDDTSDVIVGETPNEAVNDENMASELSDLNVEPRSLTSENQAPSDGANDENVSPEHSASKSESRNSISENKARNGENDENVSPKRLASGAEPRKSISENEARSDGENDENVSPKRSASIAEPRNSISEDKARSDGENDENVSPKRSASIAESRNSISEEKAPSDGANEPESSKSSINNENPINSDEIEENLVLAKSKKSSIVTESPTSGVNGGEVSSVSEEDKRHKSASNGVSSDAGERRESTSDKIEEKKLLEKEIEAERKAPQSDDESEYDGYPAFKDIPADEWTGGNTKESKKRTEADGISLQSVSTERNESDGEDFNLVVKEVAPSAELEDQAKSDYDSDDTVKIAIASEKPDERVDEEKEEEEPVASQETPMDLSSDAEEEEQNREINTKANDEISNKRASLNSSRKINEKNTPVVNKNISLIANTSVKGSPVKLNVSRRKSLLCLDDDSNDNSNSSIKLNNSLSKSLKKRSLNVSVRPAEDTDSDNEGEDDNAQVSTPKVIARKSLDASGKKLKDRVLDRSKTSVSTKNTPTNAEKRANEASAKRSRSLNNTVLSSLSDGAEDSSDNVAESEPTRKVNEAENLQLALKKQLRGRLSANNASDSSSRNDSPASPKIDKERYKTSHKIGSARQSLNEKNSSKIAASSSDSDIEIGETQEDSSTSESQLNSKKSKINKNELKNAENSDTDIEAGERQEDPPSSAKIRLSAKKSANKNNSKISFANRSSEFERESYQESPASPDQDTTDLDKSVKLGSVKKSANKNSFKLVAASSDSEVEDDDSQEKLISSSNLTTEDEDAEGNLSRSKKSGSTKKSVINKNYSTIAQINSDSNVDDDVESDSSDDVNISRQIPRFLFGNNNSSSDEDDLSASIDPDVARELNLDGRSLEYSDDDVPADDCMETESESSDDDDGSDLADFVVDDEEDVEVDSEDAAAVDSSVDEDEAVEVDYDEDVAIDLGVDDDERTESFKREKTKPRKRIITRPAGDSDSDEINEEAPTNVSSTHDSSKTAKSNKTQEVVEPQVKSVDLNLSAKGVAARNKNLLIQSSTPKTIARQSLLLEKSNSSKVTTPLNTSLKLADTSEKLNVSTSKRLSRSVCEAVDTSTKLASSLMLAKNPRASLSVQQQLQTSLPVDLPDSVSKTNLSKTKSTKTSMLNKTVMPSGSDSPETRFLMKEKLNDSMPALKLQQRARALRRSVLDNLREEAQTTDKVLAEIGDIQETAAEKRMSLGEEEAADETEVSSEKKKKKKKKKNKENATENSEAKIDTSIVEIVTEADDGGDSLGTSSKKSKKLSKKKKPVLGLEAEEPEVAEIPKKKKKPKESPEKVDTGEVDKDKKKKNKKQEESIEIIKVDETDKKKKKKKKPDESTEVFDEEEADKKEKKTKKRKIKQEVILEKIELDIMDKDKKKKKKGIKSAEAVEIEVPTLRQKSRRLAAQNVRASDSDDAPEAIGFTEARDAALRDLRMVTESIKAGQEVKKKKNQDLPSRQERKTKTRAETVGSFEKMKTSVKRLPDDVLENLSDVAERPKKRRKVAKEEKAASSRTIVGPYNTQSGDFIVDDGYVPLSTSGGTTQFTVVNLKKAVKHSKKAVAAVTFRERMLARNPRQPVSAYLMYQQKQKASGKDRPY